MKKKIVIVSIVLLFILGIIGGIKLYSYIRVKTAKVEVVLKSDMTLEFNDKAKVSDYIESINGKIIDDYNIDSSKIGVKTIEFKFINDDGIKLKYKYDLEVVDTIPPVIWLSGSYRVRKGAKIDLASAIMCGDNYDSSPNCFIEGEYDLNKEGKYKLVYKAIDQSNNMHMEKFTLTVYTPGSSSSSSGTYKSTRTKFSDVIKKHKTDKTSIGIDVSKWQGDIDFDALKSAGVEFIMIRVGTTKGTYGEYVLDPKFKRNIQEANRVGIKAGIYFYTYATDIKSARSDALWVVEHIKDYKIDLPVAFDWEDWNNFNEYGISFYELTSLSNEFVKILNNNGYKGMLYSSKSYLEYIWYPVDYDVWLAHYTNKTSYKGKYLMWQLCSNGKVDGINGNVDIDVMYHN